MGITNSTPFSSGMEYEYFKENFCERCVRHKVREDDGFPEFPEKGGCPIEDAMENARFDINKFPTEDVVKLTNRNEEIIAWNVCKSFTCSDDNVQIKFYAMLRKAGYLNGDIHTEL